MCLMTDFQDTLGKPAGTEERNSKSTTMVGFWALFSVTDRTSKQIITKNGGTLESASHRHNWTDVFQTIHPTVENTHSFLVHMEYSSRSIMVGYKIVLNIFNGAEIMLSDHKIEVAVQ